VLEKPIDPIDKPL